jgi:hypothetical protein
MIAKLSNSSLSTPNSRRTKAVVYNYTSNVRGCKLDSVK